MADTLKVGDKVRLADTFTKTVVDGEVEEVFGDNFARIYVEGFGVLDFSMRRGSFWAGEEMYVLETV